MPNLWKQASTYWWCKSGNGKLGEGESRCELGFPLIEICQQTKFEIHKGSIRNLLSSQHYYRKYDQDNLPGICLVLCEWVWLIQKNDSLSYVKVNAMTI